MSGNTIHTQNKSQVIFSDIFSDIFSTDLMSYFLIFLSNLGLVIPRISQAFPLCQFVKFNTFAMWSFSISFNESTFISYPRIPLASTTNLGYIVRLSCQTSNGADGLLVSPFKNKAKCSSPSLSSLERRIALVITFSSSLTFPTHGLFTKSSSALLDIFITFLLRSLFTLLIIYSTSKGISSFLSLNGGTSIVTTFSL